ncbi:hypothetical protein DB2_49 [Octadecabacter Antarctic DB virus 2]|nr:hypothetical protein DB2_49 [Octadecabacter Antarctic DB virus 2]
MSLPYFPMFPTDFEAKTSHLTLAEDGAYNRLLRLMWMTPGCSLPDDDKWIMRRMRVDQSTFDDVVLIVIDEFCTRENGRVSNAKLTRVFASSNDAHQKRVSAGSKGGKAKSLKTNNPTPSNATAKPKQPEPEPEPYKERESKDSCALVVVVADAIDGVFEEFWTHYPRKIGKAAASKAFAKASKKHKTDDILFGLSQQIDTMKSKEQQFIPHAATWLNAERWTDEPEQPNNSNNLHGHGAGSQAGERIDPALERIARLAGVVQTPSDGGL